MATVKEINHDSSTTIGDHYTTSVTDLDGAITVTSAARLNFSTYGVNTDFDAGSNIAILEEAYTPNGTNDFRFRFRVKLNGLTNTNAGVPFCWIDIIYDEAIVLVRIEINANSGDGGYNIKGYYRDGGKGGGLLQVGTGSDAISSTDEVCIEMSVLENSPGDVDIDILVNSSSVQAVTAIADMKEWVTLDEIEVTFDPDANLAGDMYYDEFILDDDSAAALCAVAVDEWAMVISSGGQA